MSTFNLFTKFFILFNLIIFNIIVFFMSDLMMIWFIMEISNFLYICFMCMKMNNKKIIFLYYIIQIIASLMLMFSLIFNNLFFMSNNFYMINFYLSLMIKLSIPPFHLWMLIMSIYMSWDILFIMLSIQKLIPFYIMSLINTHNFFIINYCILSSSYISTFKMINNLNYKMMLSLSSINQTSWMLLLVIFKNMFWLIYMIIYTLILMILMLFISLFKISFNFNLNNNNSMNFNMICLLLIFNLASIPPLSFFLLKWLSIFIVIMNSEFQLILILMMINSLILIYIYINMLVLTMFMMKFKSKLFNMSINYFTFLKINKIPLILYISLILSTMIILI